MQTTYENNPVSPFAPQHRKAREKYVVKPNLAVRRKTFALLRKIQIYCNQENESNKNISASKRKKLCELFLATEDAIFYIKMMKKTSNVRLTRFYYFLSRKQKEVLINHNIKTLVDVSKITRQELAKLLRLGRGNPDPSFLIILGLS